MKKLMSVMVLTLAMVTPVLAGEGGASGKTLSFIEFSELQANRGIHDRVLTQRYDAYRSGRLPVTTLDTSSIR